MLFAVLASLASPASAPRRSNLGIVGSDTRGASEHAAATSRQEPRTGESHLCIGISG
jgi:hypothetical protein